MSLILSWILILDFKPQYWEVKIETWAAIKLMSLHPFEVFLLTSWQVDSMFTLTILTFDTACCHRQYKLVPILALIRTFSSFF